MKKQLAGALALLLALSLSACAAHDVKSAPAEETETPAYEQTESETPAEEETPAYEQTESETSAEEETQMLQMMIGESAVAVDWEENESVEALRELCREAPLTVSMSMYGGFEQVGSLGKSLPRSDVQITTEAGDIVLYSGDQIVVFYGSNAWAYTRLGHITDRSAGDMAALLGQGDVTITLRLEENG